MQKPGKSTKNPDKSALKPVKPAAPTQKRAAKKPAPAPAPSPPVEAKPPRNPGQPPHVPDDKSRARVTAWSGGGIEQDLIAASLGISTPTLVKHYGPQLAVGKATMDGLAISALAAAMQRGGKEAVIAAKWWTQSRMGWTDRLLDDDRKATDTKLIVVIDFVGDAPIDYHRPAKARPDFDPSIVQLVG